MGKRPAKDELFKGNMGSIQSEDTCFYTKRRTYTAMTTGFERIAVKARSEPKLQFTTLAHHINKEMLWESLTHIPNDSAVGVDGLDVKTVKEEFENWADEVITAIHHGGYKPPPVRRVYIPKPGKSEKRPLGVPCIGDRALQRSVTQVLSQIYEQDFLPVSFGGRPKLGAHHALCTLNEIIAGKKVGWVYEADIKNFFGSLSHEWVNRFMEHRVGDPRIQKLIQRWLTAGVMEEGKLASVEEGTPQGGSISVLLSNIYLHYVLDLWFEKQVKPRMRGECYLVRYIDDFLVCFQYRADAIKFQNVLPKRLQKFSLALEPNKTKLVEFGRFSQKHSKERGRKQETIYFLGFTHFCSRNRRGNYQVSRKTEKSRLRRSLTKLKELMFKRRHDSLKDQAKSINQILRGHYGYYGLGGNLGSLHRVHREAEKWWRKALSSRCWKGELIWEKFQKLKTIYPLQRPKLHIPYNQMQRYAVL
jgi:RNA-directed DNA polymerase